MPHLKKLGDKQKRFAREYLKDLNAKEAAIRAGYSAKTAAKKGHCLTIDPLVAEYISELKTKRNERLDIDADYVLNRLMQIDVMDVADIMNDNGSLKPISKWPQIWRQMISGLDIAELGGGEDVPLTILKKLKWPDKVKNLELLGKHVKVQAFKDRIEHEGDIKDLVPVINLTLSGAN